MKCSEIMSSKAYHIAIAQPHCGALNKLDYNSILEIIDRNSTMRRFLWGLPLDKFIKLDGTLFAFSIALRAYADKNAKYYNRQPDNKYSPKTSC